MMQKNLLPGIALALALNISSQPATPAPGVSESTEFDYPTVAAALTALLATPGLDKVFREDGWLGFSDTKNKIIWAFAPNGHPAYPIVVKRVMIGEGKTMQVKTSYKCEAPKAACDKLMLQFYELDGNASDYVQFQNRNAEPKAAENGTASPQPAGK
jgi:hypothetical protein